MSLASLLKHTVTVKRPTATTGVKKTYQGSASLPCFIQPLDAVAAQAVGLAFGKAYRCYVEAGVDVREGDELTDQTGRVFFVKGLRERNYGSTPHRDLILSEDKRP